MKLQGGLGNQMFQYAIARAFAKENEKIVLDLNFLKTYNVSSQTFTARNYELNVFPNLNVKTNSYIPNLFYGKNIFKSLCIRMLQIQTIKQFENELVEIPLKYKSVYLDGYFQSEYYFKSIRNSLLNDFRFPELDMQNLTIQREILSNNHSVSLHIRRGDYAQLANVGGYHGILPLIYYTLAIDSLQSKIGSDIKVFVFTDDIEWVKNNFKYKNLEFTFVEGNTSSNSWKDMALMSMCRHHIIANSSFSWWGAWLSTRNGYKYAPANWFNPERVVFNIQNIVPTDWNIVA